MVEVFRDDLNVLRKEFHTFWEAGLHGRDYINRTAIVCYLDLDEDKVTLTRVFYRGPDVCSSQERAEDLMIDWFTEEQLIQVADTVEINLYMSYSPQRLTVDGLVSVVDNLKAMGKEVKISLKFVELYKCMPGEDESEENREGLRILKNYGIRMDVLKGKDWLFLLQTLTKKSAKKRQNALNNDTRFRLKEVLQDPRDEETSTDPPNVSPALEESSSPLASPQDKSHTCGRSS